MTLSAWQSPDTAILVGGGSWTPAGTSPGTVVGNVAAPDDDSNYVFASNGADYNSRYTQWTVGFTGLPANAQVISVRLRYRRALSGGGGTLIQQQIQDQTWLPSGTWGDGWNTTGEFTQSLSGLGYTVDGSGNFTAKIALGTNGSVFGYNISTIEMRVEYNQAPSAPTITAPIGTVGTLTPTITGNYSDPDGTPQATVEIEVRRVSDNALFWASGVLASSGSTFSKVYAGTTLVSGIQYKVRARNGDNLGAIGAWSGFTNFTPVTNVIPTTTIVSPLGNALVGTLTPTLQFTYADADGDAQSAYQIQVRRFSDQVSFWDTAQVAGAVTSRVYAGTTLAGGTRYEWRVRVWDSKAAASNYTAWESFTPQSIPDPPSSLLPSGLQNTLTPTISGVYNQASGAPQAGFQYEIRQGGVNIYQSGDVLVAIATGQVYGTNNAGDIPASPPALAWGTSYDFRVRSKDTGASYSAWSGYQSFNTNSAPTTPTGLSPNGAVVGDTTPTLVWTHNDPDGDAQTVAEVELRKVSDDSVVTGYGPKSLSQATTSHDVTQVLVASPATEYKWRVRTKGLAAPGFGPWSSWVNFTVATGPTFTISNPAPAQVVAAPALTVTWGMAGGSGVQQSWRIQVSQDLVAMLHDTGVLAGVDTSYTLPVGVLRNAGAYYVRLLGVDTLAQSAQTSWIPFTTAWTPPAMITGLTAQSIGSQT